jgi:hypothetical protein
MIMMAILLFASITMMVVAYAFKKGAIAFMAATMWVVFLIYCYTQSTLPVTGVWDIYAGLLFLGLSGALLCALEPVIMKPRKEDVKDDIFVDDIDNFEKDLKNYSRQTRIPRVYSRRRPYRD